MMDFREEFSPAPACDLSPAHELVRALRDAISRNRFSPGLRLNLTELAETTSFSRESIEAAALLLEDEGLVARLTATDVKVRAISEIHARNAHFLREQTEVAILRRVAEIADTALLTDLREQIMRQKLVSARGPQDLLRLDDRFHLTLCEAAGYGSLWPQLERWKRCTDRVHFTMGTYDSSPEAAIEQHAAIVDCLAMRDGDGAAAAMRYHLQQAKRLLAEFLHDETKRPDPT
ncbi:hypothetical protein AYJ57_06920 [Salipiger sp. CCB-MM3]|uniref:GntR family transcriptional regulator n=1 Tax=Salipiger sp. CCB-MM3 TaxID=1792508 RepID=UPI00080A9C48|nr:GntR family transcriptional regulator [Salipiger sp. CCB-MM3]ANT60118.1 hypothetical protein AYJ57_06920 [Salipiger sp. CCB-MM3]